MTRLGSVLGVAGLALLSTAFAIMPSASASASAQPVAARSAARAAVVPNTFVGDTTLKNTRTGRCVDFSRAYGLRPFNCNNTSFQEWRIDALNSSGTLVRFQNLNTGACLVEVPGVGLGATGCNPSAPGQQWWSSTWRVNGVLFGWFQTNANGFGCLDDSMQFSLRVAACVPDQRDNDASQVWRLDL